MRLTRHDLVTGSRRRARPITRCEPMRRVRHAWPLWLVILPGYLAMRLIAPAVAETKRIFIVPPMQWDHEMSRDRTAHVQSPSDLADLTGGIVFGLSPSEVNAQLPVPTQGVEWADLPFATEYPDEVRYFWVRLDAMRDPGDGITGCVGANSYVVFLFRKRSLFRVSWRLLPDNYCASTRVAAEDIFARFVAMDRTVVLATHYRPGKADAVEITDPTVDYLMPYRWANRLQR